ncbi:anti-sigma factor [Polaribacter filamentus]|uniref:Anti-sigma factor n=1 Tax=Polaribacter filamentus TaxID=53483 RepID=A0A2S7KKR3_9FLAO|nr:FecR family protein [Polaribacter filamentus]PQB03208.1 anti-sigma factor [Polaribacter filamentus]
MKKSTIEKIIVKFINQEANQSELKALDLWLKNDENKIIFNHFIKTEYLIAVNLADYNVEKAKVSIKNKIEINKKKRRASFVKTISIAASIIILLGVSFFQYTNNNNTIENIATQKDFEEVSNRTILTLNNGKNISLDTDKKYSSNKVKGNSKELLYSSKNIANNTTKELTYNYLTIPRGGEFFVQLSDGTKIWLNSDSKLKYPENFNNGEIRKVELVYGEAYFEVSPSELHHGDAFHVITKNQEVTVLGTHFNIKAYKEDRLISTTLLEGKVKVNNGLNAILLKPNQQSKVFNKTNFIEVLSVDVSHEVAWIKGFFSFKEAPLDEIMKILSRRYNVEVIFESEEIKKYQFTGVLERKTAIKDVLKFFEATSNGDLKYTITDRKIVIK